MKLAQQLRPRAAAAAEHVVRTPGRPLDASLRSDYESRFAHDFSRVRVHDDARAAQSAQALGARAYTAGSHIVFGAGAFEPRVLEHELTHVVQQRNAPMPQRLGRASAEAEREAEAPGREIGAHPAAIAMQPIAQMEHYLHDPLPQGPITLDEFRNYMLFRYQCPRVDIGTFDEQHGITPALTQAQWTQFDPGATNQQMLTEILLAIEQFETAFGGTPPIRRVVFFNNRFVMSGGAAVADTGAGASYGAGELTIYSIAATAAPVVATDRNRPGLRTPTEMTPGDLPSRIRRNIIHELGHGIEHALSPGSTQLRDEFERAVGWIRPTPSTPSLIDPGDCDVDTTGPEWRPIRRGRSPQPVALDASNWNAPYVCEQPPSAYATTDSGDDLAETMAAYVQRPDVLRRRSPRRWAFVQRNYSRIQAALLHRPPGPGDYPTPPRGRRNA